jgi:hypothetical protein
MTHGDTGTEQYIPRPVYVRAARRHHDERLVCLSCLIRAGGHGPDARTTSRGIRFFGAGRTAPALRAAETRTTSLAQVGAWSCRFPPRKCDVGAYTTKARSGRLPVVRCACVASPPCSVEREREKGICAAPPYPALLSDEVCTLQPAQHRVYTLTKIIPVSPPTIFPFSSTSCCLAVLQLGFKKPPAAEKTITADFGFPPVFQLISRGNSQNRRKSGDFQKSFAAHGSIVIRCLLNHVYSYLCTVPRTT